MLIVTLLLGLTCLSGITGKEITVSSENGTDNTKCGNRTTPCQSLLHAILYAAESNDIINIDGGKTKPMKYFHTNIKLNKSLHIRKTPASVHRPIFMPSPQLSKLNLPLFDVYQQNTLTVSSIDFEGLNLATYKKAFGVSLYIENCLVKIYTSYPFVHLDLDNNAEDRNYIEVTNCTVNHSNHLIYSVGISLSNAYIILSNSQINGVITFKSSQNRNYFRHSIRNTSLRIINTAFTDTKYTAVYVNDKINSVWLQNVYFKNCAAAISINNRHRLDFTAHYCNFEASPVYLKNVLGGIYATNFSYARYENPNQIAVIGSQLVFKHCLFANKTGEKYMALEIRSSNVNIQYCSFVRNRGYTGAVYSTDSTVLINNSVFLENNGKAAGAIQMNKSSNIFINSSNFIGNSGAVGAVSILKSTNISFSHCYFQENSGFTEGVFSVNDCKRISVWYSNFSNNKGNQSAGIRIWNSSFTGKGIKFKKNNGGSDGTAVSLHLCYTSTMESLEIVNNTAANSAAGVLIRESTVEIENAVVNNNTALWGAGITIRNSNVTIRNSVISDNKAGLAGGIYIFGSNVKITTSVLQNNVAKDDPSALYYNGFALDKGALSMMDSKIIAPESPVIGAVWILAPFNKRFKIFIRNVSVLLKSSKCGVRSISVSSASRYANVDFSYTCPVNHNPEETVALELGIANEQNYLYTFYCSPCPRGFYSLKGGHDHVAISPIFNRKPTEQHNATCFKCPPGSNCNEAIKSRDNFWAYKHGDNDELLQFLPCPTGYCCNRYGQECTSFKSCNHNREGSICGRCTKGYHVSYFSNDCISNNYCKRIASFWIIYIMFAVFYAFLLTFLPEISFFSKYFINKLIDGLMQKLRKSKALSQNEELSLNEIENGSIECSDTLTNDDSFWIIETYPNEKDTRTVINANTQFMKQNSKLSGIFKIMVSYYQIRSLITIELNEREDRLHIFEKTMSSIFNFQIPVNSITTTICPVNNLTAISRAFIKEFLFINVMLMLILIGNGCVKVYKLYQNRYHHVKYCKSLLMKIRKCTIQIILMGYTVMATFCLSMVNCQKVKDENILYITGNVVCYTWWQKCIISFLVFWIIPFPMTFFISIKMLKKNLLTVNQFFICVFMPLSTLFYLIKCRYFTHYVDKKYLTEIENLNAMFEEPFRCDKSGQPISWDSWRLFQRFVLAVFATFFINPIERMSFILPAMLFFLVIHLLVKPYKNALVNWLETTTLVSLCFLVGVNMFRAFFYVYPLAYETHIIFLINFFSKVEFFCNPPVILICLYTGRFLRNFFVKRLLNKQH